MAIKVRDLGRAETFYREVLGLPLVRRWPHADGQRDRSVWLASGDGGFVALERVDDETPLVAAPPEGGHHLFALRIQPGDRGRWKRRLIDAGVAIETESPYTLFFRDPEGNRLGLSHHPVAADTVANG